MVVMPVSTTTEAGLLYRAWIDANRAEVAKLSGGRLGYVHLADMSDHALKQLYLDLDAQNESKDGVVIDVRNNNGGYVNGYALDVFTRRNYLLMTLAVLPTSPSRQLWASALWANRPSCSPTNLRSPTAKISPKAIARCIWARWSACRPRAGSSTPAARN